MIKKYDVYKRLQYGQLEYVDTWDNYTDPQVYIHCVSLGRPQEYEIGLRLSPPCSDYYTQECGRS